MKPTADEPELMKIRETLVNVTSSLSVLSPLLPKDVSQACKAALEVFRNLEKMLIATKPAAERMADYSEAKQKLKEASDRVRTCARKSLPFTKFKEVMMEFMGHFRDSIIDNEALSGMAAKIEDHVNLYCFLEEVQRLEPAQVAPPVIRQKEQLQRRNSGSLVSTSSVHDLENKVAQFTSDRKVAQERMKEDMANLRKEISDLKEKIDRISKDFAKKVDETQSQIMKEIQAVEQEVPKPETLREFEKQMSRVADIERRYDGLWKKSEEQAKKLRDVEQNEKRLKQQQDEARQRTEREMAEHERKNRQLTEENKQLQSRNRQLTEEKQRTEKQNKTLQDQVREIQNKQHEEARRRDDSNYKRLLGFMRVVYDNSIPSD